MTDKEFDGILKSKLEQFDEAYDQESWDILEKRIEDEGLTEDNGFDQTIRAAMTGFTGVDSVPDWELMEQRLTADEARTFDQEVKEKVGRYDAPYDPASWLLMSDKISEDDRMRRRLIAAKVLEFAAVLIAIVTLFNFLPLLEKVISDDKQAAVSVEESIYADDADLIANSQVHIDNIDTPTGADQAVKSNNTGEGSDAATAHNITDNINSGSDIQPTGQSNTQLTQMRRESVPAIQGLSKGVRHDLLGPAESWCEVQPVLRSSVMSVKTETLGLPEALNADIGINLPPSGLPGRGKSIRLGISTSLDVNRLHMPTDQFYADGRKIKFSEKDLVATGYSLGASVLLDRGRWSFETGLQYSQKSFEPNRVLKLGNTFDVRTVDFEEISMHVVSVPLNAFWNFDRKGKTRVYAVGGVGLNLIASANYDLLTRGNVGSQPPGGTRTDYEVARVREHFLDGAEFSSKAFITAAAGIGIDHHLSRKISIFAQPSYHYQVPFFVFSDREGKHIQFLSMQIGTRIRIK